jgi:hypothetical protein
MTINLLQVKLRKTEEQLRVAQRKNEVLLAVLAQHLALTKRDGDDEAAEGIGEFEDSRPCICAKCRTYRAALWFLEDHDAT